MARVIRPGTLAAGLLLLKRPEAHFMGGIWELPSGKVELNEALDEPLIREVKEETGRTVTGIPDYLGSFDYQSGSGKHSRQFNFAADVAAPEPIKRTEHHFPSGVGAVAGLCACPSGRWIGGDDPPQGVPSGTAVRACLSGQGWAVAVWLRGRCQIC